MKVTNQDVLQMARLSKLYIDESELDELTEAMSQIISFADTINAAASDNCDFDNINQLSNVLREDTVIPSYPREEILSNAESQDDGYFLVKKRS
ncbi:MAG: Asp-tRNA(Asn)/Glu-tRNA(Gln) amidotransferase subunit GatC [Oscillospiraceae bacterium]|nr:Asp-tRNA(Asn)/Glu-tRNA(Gln) amidotransferase subunit GatC [Oscillospiraceae bacterium]